MAYVIEFRTALFDVSSEPENPINPIFGHSVLKWLGARLQGEGIQAQDPDAEDWGWYFDVSGFGSTYLVGAASLGDEDDSTDGPIDWMIQIEKHRRMSERLLGRNKLDPGDALCELVERIIRSEPQIECTGASSQP